ncbi:YceH family protein [Erwiniaceae bacterium CAU 1747]
MKNPFNAIEARVVGCLLEKQVTTPDQYPMSLNGVVTACNQKSNREPVMSLSDSEVQNTLDLLIKKHQLTAISGFGSRVVKYEQRFCNSEFGQLKFSPAEVALITTLLLRGAQTPGELRTRSSRMHDFSDMAEVEQTLEGLSNREGGALVVRLAREPGKRESRYMHLFSGEPDEASLAGVDSNVTDEGLSARVAQLEEEVAQLKQQLSALFERLEDQ